jgi:hypothetical protein
VSGSVKDIGVEMLWAEVVVENWFLVIFKREGMSCQALNRVAVGV